MRRMAIGLITVLGAGTAPLAAEVPVTLRGSPESMVRQNQAAMDRGLAFAETPAHIRELKAAGELVRLEGNRDYGFGEWMDGGVARPEMRTFIERLGAQYHAATGEKLIVTSLTRAKSRQPGNSHPLSVHPTGMAVDLRVSQRAESREWLEATLLSLERQGLLDITREYRPPHYHLALFPDAYMAHVERLTAAEAAEQTESTRALEEATRFTANALAERSAADVAPAAKRPAPWPILAAIPIAILAGAVVRRRRRHKS